MRDVIGELARLWHAGEPVALATVTHTWSSAPRPAGSVMALTAGGLVLGSVSAGCIEAEVYEDLLGIHAGQPSARRSYGVTDDNAQAHGLTCGGIIEIYTELLSQQTFPDFATVADDIRAGRPVAVLTLIDGPDGPDAPDGQFGRHHLIRPDAVIRPDGSPPKPAGPLQAAIDTAGRMLAAGETALATMPDGAGFVSCFPPLPVMLVFGASDLAAAVASLASTVGYRVTVCDARATFATTERFPDAAEVVVDWPHRYLARAANTNGALDQQTAICIFTHDLKFEIPLLQLALTLPVGYVGALGSRRTTAARAEALTEAGVTVEQLARLRAPIGLDLKARTPAEISVSVLAEVIAVRRGGPGAAMTFAGV